MSAAIDSLSRLLGTEALRAAAGVWFPRLLGAGLALFVFWLLWRGLSRVLDVVLRGVDLDQTASAFVRAVARLALFLIGGVTALDQLGVDTTSILASLGVMGLTLGFAAQDTLGNVISGLFIFWDRPFVLGDLVEVDGEYGRVDQITLRSTRLVTPDGRMFAIPNKVIANVKVASYTNFPHLRLDLDVTVGVGEDLGRCRRLLLGIVADDPAFLVVPAPEVVVMSLNDYNVALQLRVWLRDEKTHIPERFRMREAVFEVLRGAGVELPLETIQLAPVEVRSGREGGHRGLDRYAGLAYRP